MIKNTFFEMLQYILSCINFLISHDSIWRCLSFEYQCLFLTCSILTAPESFRLLQFTETQVVVFNICITNACLLMSMMVYRITSSFVI